MESKVLHFFAPVLIILLFSSCTTMLLVEQPVPPEILLEETGHQMLIQNYFDYTSENNVKEKHEAVLHDAVSAFTEELVNYLTGNELIQARVIDTLVQVPAGLSTLDLLRPDSISALCLRNQADLLLVLDSIFVSWDSETETIEEDDGSKSKNKYIYLYVNPFLSLYNHQGYLVDRSYVSHRLLYTERTTLTGLVTIYPSLAKARDEVVLLASEGGKGYGDKFFISMEHFPYKVYYWKPFGISYKLMQRGEWSEAIRNLLPMADSPDPKIAQRAAHNLWVAYTGFGNEKEAEKWLEISEKIKSNR